MNLAGETVDGLLDAVAAKAPVPGGGAVASLTAATGAALALMVLNYSAGKKSLAAHADLHEEARAALEAARAEALDLAEADARAYGRLNDLWKLPEDDERRTAAFPDAVRGAVAVPAEVLSRCLDLLDLLVRLEPASNRMLKSDLAIAAVLTEAAARSAAWNVRINLPLLDDEAERARIDGETVEALARARRTTEAIETACRA